MDWTYERFLTAVKIGRGLSDKDVRGAADGHVWTGRQAQQRKLVDQLGGLSQAIARAAALAELSGDDVGFTIVTGHSEALGRLSLAAKTLVGDPTLQTRQTLERLVGDPTALFLLEENARPLARLPAGIEVR